MRFNSLINYYDRGYIEDIVYKNRSSNMKSILTVLVTSVLMFALGCNYDYGKYGKNKTESGSGETNGQEAIPKQEAGPEN